MISLLVLGQGLNGHSVPDEMRHGHVDAWRSRALAPELCNLRLSHVIDRDLCDDDLMLGREHSSQFTDSGLHGVTSLSPGGSQHVWHLMDVIRIAARL